MQMKTLYPTLFLPYSMFSPRASRNPNLQGPNLSLLTSTVDPAYNTTGYKTSLVITPEMARTKSIRDFTKKMARL